MLAFVANTTASWESFMNTTDGREQDHAQKLLAVTEPAASDDLVVERITRIPSFELERKRETRDNFRGRFLTTLLRALAAWPA